MRQLSLFGVEATDPCVVDLAGLLAGPAQVARIGGTARISVLVTDAWRVHVLMAELAGRGLAGTWEASSDQRHEVRTSYTAALAPLAAAWLSEAGKHPPPGFHLNGRRLRLWTAAAGIAEPNAFLLRLGDTDHECWSPVGAALAAVGLPAVLIDSQSGGPAWRISGCRRLARLAELVGERPAAAPAAVWPQPDSPGQAGR